MAAAPTPDAKRYTFLNSVQIDGPDGPTYPIIGTGYELSEEAASGSLAGIVAETTASVSFEEKFSLFGVFEIGLRTTLSLEWDYENTTSTTTGKKQTATATLTTPTVERHDIYDIYYDQAYKTFAFVAKPPPPKTPDHPKRRASLQGTVTKHGKPAANEIVTITLPDHKKRRLATNASGKFRAFDLDLGTQQVQVGNQTKSVVVAKDQPAELTIELPAR